MEAEIDSFVKHYYDKKVSGMDFSEIRYELKIKGLSDPDIKIVIKSIDNKLLSSIRQKQDKSSVNTTRIIGVLLVVGGTIVTVGSYAGWIRLGNYVLFAYGPILGGLAMLAASKNGRSTIFESSRRTRN